jgi:hypothetical protein
MGVGKKDRGIAVKCPAPADFAFANESVGGLLGTKIETAPGMMCHWATMMSERQCMVAPPPTAVKGVSTHAGASDHGVFDAPQGLCAPDHTSATGILNFA